MTETIIVTVKNGERTCEIDATAATMAWTAEKLLQQLANLSDTSIAASDKQRYARALSDLERS